MTTFTSAIHPQAAVFVDTCFALDERFPDFCQKFADEKDVGFRLRIIPSIQQELKTHAQETERQKSQAGKRALKALRTLAARRMAVVTKTIASESDSVSKVLLRTVMRQLPQRDVHVLTNDNKLIRNLHQLGETDSGQNSIQVWTLQGTDGAIARLQPEVEAKNAEQTTLPEHTVDFSEPPRSAISPHFIALGLSTFLVIVAMFAYFAWKGSLLLDGIVAVEQRPELKQGEEDEAASDDTSLVAHPTIQEQPVEATDAWTNEQIAEAINSSSGRAQRVFQDRLRERLPGLSAFQRNAIRDILLNCELKTEMLEEDRRVAAEFEALKRNYEETRSQTESLIQRQLPPATTDAELQWAPVLFIKSLGFSVAADAFDLSSYTESEQTLLRSDGTLGVDFKPTVITEQALNEFLEKERFHPRGRNPAFRRIFNSYHSTLVTKYEESSHGGLLAPFEQRRVLRHSLFKTNAVYATLGEERPYNARDLWEILKDVECDFFYVRRAVFASFLFNTGTADYYNVDLSRIDYRAAARRGRQDFTVALREFNLLFDQLDRLYNAYSGSEFFEDDDGTAGDEYTEIRRTARNLAPRDYSWSYDSLQETFAFEEEQKDFEDYVGMTLEESMAGYNAVLDKLIDRRIIENLTPELAALAFQENHVVSKVDRMAVFARIIRAEDNPVIEYFHTDVSEFDFFDARVSDAEAKRRYRNFQRLFFFCEEAYARVNIEGERAVKALYQLETDEIDRMYLLKFRERSKPFAEAIRRISASEN